MSGLVCLVLQPVFVRQTQGPHLTGVEEGSVGWAQPQRQPNPPGHPGGRGCPSAESRSPAGLGVRTVAGPALRASPKVLPRRRPEARDSPKPLNWNTRPGRRREVHGSLGSYRLNGRVTSTPAPGKHDYRRPPVSHHRKHRDFGHCPTPELVLVPGTEELRNQ